MIRHALAMTRVDPHCPECGAACYFESLAGDPREHGPVMCPGCGWKGMAPRVMPLSRGYGLELQKQGAA